MARDPIWYPSYLNGKEQSMTGFTDDLMATLGRRKGFNIEIFSPPSRNLFSELESDNFDGILSGLPRDYSLKGNYAFSDPFYLVGPVLVVTADSTITSLEEMGGKTVGIMSEVNPIFDIAYYPNINLRFFGNIVLALESLKNNQIDGVIAYALPAYNNIRALFCHHLKVATAPLTKEGVRLVLRKSADSKQFLTEVNQGLQEIKESGEYQKLLARWGLVDTAKPTESDCNQGTPVSE